MKNSDFQFMNDLIVDRLDEVTEMSESSEGIFGLPTGFSDIDLMTSGFQAGDLIVIASRPSIGKSTLAINMAEHIAIDEGLPVTIFSMELNPTQVSTRIIASRGRIKTRHITTGQLTDEEWPSLVYAVEVIRDAPAPIAIHGFPGMNIVDLREKSIQLKESCGALGVVIVDCLQMMQGIATDNLLGLKALAKELNCPVILTSQIVDSVEFRADKRPTMFDIRDIPGMEYIPDTLMFLYRDEHYTKAACREPGVAEINFIRQRTGPTGVVKLAFIEQISKFETLANYVNL
jgi:replicative DNA helicase